MSRSNKKSSAARRTAFTLVEMIVVATIIALLAFAMYQAKVISASRMAVRFRPIYRVLINKYYMDELYENIIVRKLFYERFARVTTWFDKAWIDGVNFQMAAWSRRVSTLLGFMQDGQLQTYGAVASAGAVVALAVFLFWA